MFKKTTARTPAAYLAQLPQPRRSDMQQLHALIRRTVPKLKPHIVVGMIGYGSHRYRYASGRQVDWPIVALASQKHYISVYVFAVFGKTYVAEKYRRELAPANIGKSCIRFRRPSDIDLAALQRVIREGVRVMQPSRP